LKKKSMYVIINDEQTVAQIVALAEENKKQEQIR
jgi:hypothetical protein